MEKSYVWSLTNRVTHILLVGLFALAYLISEEEQLEFHSIFGILLGFVFLFRIIWGFIGPKYSKFKDFDFNKKDLKEYLSSPFSNVKEHIGHNPASSWAVIAMIILGLLSVISGMLAYGIEQNHGVFSPLYSITLKNTEIFEGLHELFVNAFLAVIIAHVVGTLIDKYIKKNDAIDSMINGYKTTKENHSIKTTIFQKLFSVIGAILFLAFTYYLVFVPQNIFIN